MKKRKTDNVLVKKMDQKQGCYIVHAITAIANFFFEIVKKYQPIQLEKRFP